MLHSRLPGICELSETFAHANPVREPVPVVPLFLNTYYPPNQPSPARCYALGQAIRQAVEAMPGSARRFCWMSMARSCRCRPAGDRP